MSGLTPPQLPNSGDLEDHLPSLSPHLKYLRRNDVEQVPGRCILLGEDVAVLRLKHHVKDLDNEGAGGEAVGDAHLPQEVLQLGFTLIHKLQRHFRAWQGNSGEAPLSMPSSTRHIPMPVCTACPATRHDGGPSGHDYPHLMGRKHT